MEHVPVVAHDLSGLVGIAHFIGELQQATDASGILGGGVEFRPPT